MTLDDYVSSDFVTRTLSQSQAMQRVIFKRGIGLAHIPVEMRDTCMDFLNVLSERNDKSILIRKHNLSTGEPRVKQIPYIHRWSDPYKNLTLSKLIYAKDYFGEDCPCFLVSLTIPHKHIDYDECMRLLKENKKKLDRKLRDLGYLTRSWVHDPHENGYPHCHMLVKGSISPERINSLRLWWSGQFGYSRDVYKHGLHVKIPNVSLGSGFSSSDDYKQGTVKHFASYMMKYISKNLTSTFDEPKLLLFNAVLWKTKSRLYGYSRDVSRYVKEKLEEYKTSKFGKKELSDWVFDSAAVCDSEGNILSEVPRRRSSPKFEYRDIYLYSVSSSSYGSSLLYALRNRVFAGSRLVKPVGGMLEVYERTVLVT